MADLSQVDDEVGALYALRPAEFVGARDALAKRLRGEGKRAEADAVKALVRPTAAAWAVNQLSRLEPEWTQALANAGRRLEAAQAALIEQGDRAAWREATLAQREAIDRLLTLAEGVLREERGTVSPALREQVRATLQAASVDATAREAVCRGRLTRELHATGMLGAGPATAEDAPAPAPKRDAPSGPGKRATTARRKTATDEEDEDRGASRSAAAERQARAERRTAEREARAAVRRAERLVTAARAAAERAGKARERARKAHDAAAGALADAQAAEQERAAELTAADRAATDAEAALAERQQAEREAREQLEALGD